MKKIVTLTNNFHNTSCRVKILGSLLDGFGQPDSDSVGAQAVAWGYIQRERELGRPSAYNRARRLLCGNSGCTCGVVR